MKKFIAILAVLASVIMPVAAQAATGNTTVNLSVNAGVLSLTAPANVSLATITASTQDQTVTGEAADWVTDDARGFKNASQPGWSLTVKATDFSDGSGSKIDVTNMTVTPNDLERRNGSSGTYASYSGAEAGLGSGATFADADDNGTSDDVAVATAGTGKGKGNFRGDLGLSLLVPADSDAATYQSTFTFTVT